jgi:integrase/recombinase XerD
MDVGCQAVICVVFFIMWRKEIQQYLQWKGTYRPNSTVTIYSRWINRFASQAQKGIEKITPKDIHQFSEWLKNEEYKPKTIEHAMNILKDYVNYWTKRKTLKIISDDVKPPRAIADSYEPITTAEYLAILTHIKPVTVKGLRDLVLIRLLHDTGARISEVAYLEPQNFDTVNRTIKIKNAKRYDKGNLFWSNDTNHFLKTYIEQNPEPFFPCVRTCQRIIQKYANLAKLDKKITCHSFRHGKAWKILDNGGTVKDVQAILRHKHPISSFKYLNWHTAKIQARAEKFL